MTNTLDQRNKSLITAAYKGDLEAVEQLLKAGTDPNLTTNHNSTALIAAAEKGHTNIINILLQNGADPNIAGSSKFTALMSAAKYNHIEAARELLSKGADSNLYDSIGRTSLAFCLENNSEEMAALLLENGACLQGNHHVSEYKTFLKERDPKIISILAKALGQRIEMGYTKKEMKAKDSELFELLVSINPEFKLFHPSTAQEICDCLMRGKPYDLNLDVCLKIKGFMTTSEYKNLVITQTFEELMQKVISQTTPSVIAPRAEEMSDETPLTTITGEQNDN